jgi:hypothetical protein
MRLLQLLEELEEETMNSGHDNMLNVVRTFETVTMPVRLRRPEGIGSQFKGLGVNRQGPGVFASPLR